MPITIKDIAKRTGVSVSTVSMVLNGKDYRISQATRSKVKAAARELNYRPNRMAAGLVTRTSKTLGLIIPDITNGYFAEMASVIEANCALNGYSLILCSTNDIPEQDVKYVNLLLERSIDGVLLVMAVNSLNNCVEECLHLLHEAEVPVLLLDREWRGGGVVNVISNNEQGGYLACSHLLELGHRRIGCITGPLRVQSSQKRLDGYARALREHGVACDAGLILEGDYHTGSGYELCGHLLEQDVTAIFSCNDMMALGVYKKLREKGLRVPQDISLIGYDNLNFTDFLEVPLTTVSQPAPLLGDMALSKMLQMLRGEKPEDTVFLPELVVRSSTAPPK